MRESDHQPWGYHPDVVFAIASNVILFAVVNELWLKPDSYVLAAIGWVLGLFFYHVLARAIRASD